MKHDGGRLLAVNKFGYCDDECRFDFDVVLGGSGKVNFEILSLIAERREGKNFAEGGQ